MNIKVLGIIAVSSILLTVILFVLTSKPPSQPSGPGIQPNPTTIVLPTVDPQLPPAEGKAKLLGTICPFPNNQLQQGLTVVAEQIPSRERFTHYIPGPIKQETIYALEVAPGVYEIFSELNRRRRLGLYSQFVLCGLDPEQCLDHALLQTKITANETIDQINICDYDWLNG